MRRPLVAVGSPAVVFAPAFGALGLLGLLASTGCAHTSEPAAQLPEPSSFSVSTSTPAAREREPSVDETAAQAPEPRRRLSKTVTLGQGSAEAYQPSASEGVGNQGARAGSPNVVINNNVTVVGGGYGYGGYGGYGYGYGGYGRSGGSDATRGRSSSSSAWRPTGWEGAQRTAAPGQTPGVGGNWAPAPSYGPSQMK